MTPVFARLFFQQLTCSVMFFLLESFCKMSAFVNGISVTSYMTSSPRNDVAVLGKIFSWFSTLKYQDDSCQKLRNCV